MNLSPESDKGYETFTGASKFNGFYLRLHPWVGVGINVLKPS
jgi:hypothetical protein